MDFNFKKLADVDALTEVPDNANALVEVDGIIKRVPGTGLGSKPETNTTTIKTAIIKQDGYDDMLRGINAVDIEVNVYTATCTNMTFEEAYSTIMAGELLSIRLMGYVDGYVFSCDSEWFVVNYFAEPCIVVAGASHDWFWTANGISSEEPPASEM